MSEKVMPAIEVEEVDESETQSYELAFHVLPTVAEGEVSSIFEAIKEIIKKEGGEVSDEEAPERFELAYEVVKHIEGKNRKFKSAYFGWIRFKAAPSAAVAINAEVEENNSILRQLLVKLTRAEEENPFRFHDAIRDLKQVVDIEESEVVTDDAEVEASDEEIAEESTDDSVEEKSV